MEGRGYSRMGLMGHFQFAFATRHTNTCKGTKASNSGVIKQGRGRNNSKVQACCFRRHFRWPDILTGLWIRTNHKIYAIH